MAGLFLRRYLLVGWQDGASAPSCRLASSGRDGILHSRSQGHEGPCVLVRRGESATLQSLSQRALEAPSDRLR